MRKKTSKTLAPGDLVESIGELFTVAAYPENIIWGGRNLLRISAKDIFGKTKVLVGEEIIKSTRKSAKSLSSAKLVPASI